MSTISNAYKVHYLKIRVHRFDSGTGQDGSYLAEFLLETDPNPRVAGLRVFHA
jgi:GDP-D-mannose dehydratase